MADHRSTGLGKLMSYILGHRPDEFGLVLEKEGFIPIKELHKAIIEEEGWSFVRKSHIFEVAYANNRQGFEIIENRIRATDVHSQRPIIQYEADEPPRILYYGARRKSYPSILQKGLGPMGKKNIHLTTIPELALRIGRRRDSQPVLLTIQAKSAYQAGIVFYKAGEFIYIIDALPVKYFTGPMITKEKKKPKNEKKEGESLGLPGSFLPELKFDPVRSPRKRKAENGPWKREARRYRRRKNRQLIND